ncbi:MAG: hypothetical protein Q8N23_16695 [Archangium sp.]|nr:hypothetical protein [Archangium sp.]MDP3154318.1 hypothetical protein [Archangium sp.]MDP3569732.1 hypothetical protein [Archangium sp.]
MRAFKPACRSNSPIKLGLADQEAVDTGLCFELVGKAIDLSMSSPSP